MIFWFLTTLVTLSILFWGLLFFLRYKSITSTEDGGSFTQIDGINLHYSVDGVGPDILLLHGIGASIFCWRYLIPLLASRYRVWAVDIKGFGRSDKPADSRYGLKHQAELLLKFVKHHFKGQAIIVGNSMGGAIAMEMAIQKPQTVSHLILLNVAYDPAIVGFPVQNMKYFNPLVSPLVAPFVSRYVVKTIMKRLYKRTDLLSDESVNAYHAPYSRGSDSIKSFIESFDIFTDKTLASRLASIPSKTLILWGEEDRLIPKHFGEKLHELIPQSQWAVHPTAGHHPQEEEALWIADQVLAFLKTTS